jgi:hypothetical protein
MRIAFLGSVVLVLAIGSGGAAILGAQPSNFGLSSYEHFTLQYTTFEGKTVQVTEKDAYIPGYQFPYGPFLVTLWQIKIPDTAPVREVWVGAFVHLAIHEYFMGFFHPTGMQPGWRVDFLEQRFDVAFKVEPDPRNLRMAYPRVYGPTFFTADRPVRRLDLYPTFLQTQLIALEDTAQGGSLCLSTNDDLARRKWLGFEMDGTTSGIRFMARWIPEQGLYDPLFILWLPTWQVRFGYLLSGFEEAVDWYRKEQLARPTSFLSSRTPASSTIHPAIRDSMFAVGVGASYSTVVLPSGQYDVSPQYRSDLLDYFVKLHGGDMLLYHLGWSLETPSTPQVIPDAYQDITPGHAALLREARATHQRVRSVGYTLPGIMHPGSTYYDVNLVRLEKDGSQAIYQTGAWPGVDYRYLCYFPERTTSIYTTVYARTMFNRLGFHGAYLDALSAAPSCYGFHQHAHPVGVNEQLVGINRMIASIRSNATIRNDGKPILFNETPTDCMTTDATALDINTWDPAYWNIHRMTYTGEEWPCIGVVFGWDETLQKPSGLEYTRELANVLAGGVRPLILWPELHGMMPTDPASDPEFAEFRALLTSYVKNYDSFWREIIFGRQFEPLDPDDLMSPVITPVAPLLSSGDPVTDMWRLPGYRPRESGKGCYPSPLRSRSSASVFAGLSEPAGQTGRRCLVLFRWTDPEMAKRLQLPSTHPLHDTNVRATIQASPRNLKARLGAVIRLYDVASKQWAVLGRLANEANTRVTLNVDFTAPGVKVLVID